MQAEPHFSWLREIAIPTFFTLLGSVLGYGAGQWRADREAGRARKAFLHAVGMDCIVVVVGPPDEHGEMTQMFRVFENVGVVELPQQSVILGSLDSGERHEFSLPPGADFWCPLPNELVRIALPPSKYRRRVDWELEPGGRLIILAERNFK
jgi:hypothetical protein